MILGAMTPVLFTYDTKWEGAGACKIRVKDFCQLVKNNSKYTCYDYKVTLDIDTHDSIIIFNKYSLRVHGPDMLRKLRKQNNKLIADYIDHPVVDENAELFDLHLASSHVQYEYCKERGIPVHFVCHNVDDRIQKLKINDTLTPRLRYYGETANTFVPPDIDVEIVRIVTSTAEKREWIDSLVDPHIHYCIRRHRDIDGCKPSSKTYVAAHANTFVIAEEGCHDNDYYLSDYPFLVRKKGFATNLKKICEKAVEAAKSKNHDYKAAMDVMADVKEQSSDHVIGRQFDEALQML